MRTKDFTEQAKAVFYDNGNKMIESVVFDNMINGLDGGPTDITTVSFTATDASGNRRPCKMWNFFVYLVGY